MKEKKKSRDKDGPNIMLFVLLGGGVLLLGVCCIAGGIGGFFLYRANAVAEPEKELLGKWQFESTFGNHQHFGDKPPTLEFREGGAFNMIGNNPAFRFDNGKWKQIGKQGQSITVEVTFQEVHVHPGKEFTFPPRSEIFHLTIPSHNELQRRINPQVTGGMRYKRI